MPLLTTDRYSFFVCFFSRRFVVCRFCTSRRCFGYSAMKNQFYFLYPKINPLRWIYFWRENKSLSRYDLFLTFLLLLVVDSSSASGQIPLSLPEIPIEQWTTTTPPPTALGRQFSVSTAAPPKKVPSLQHCLLSDGGLDAEKYLRRQVTAREWSLWRTSPALKLIHGIGESLSAGVKARSLAPGIKKTRAPRCV